MNMIIDNIFTKVNLMLADELYDEAAEELMAWQPASLARYYLENTPLQKTLRKPDFNDLWHAKLSRLVMSESPDFKFVSQPGIGDADIFLGHIFYLMAIKNKQEGNLQDYKLYLKNSMIHHSIPGHQTCLHEIIFTEHANLDGVEKNVARLLEDWLTVANLQGTPGYLLLASGYLQLAKISLDIGHSEQHQLDYCAAWKYLHMAKLSEKYCDAAINNAWFGKGMGLSNPFQFQSIDEMILGCSAIAKATLSDEDKFKAESEAKREFGSLTQSLKSPGWSLSLARKNSDNHDLNADGPTYMPQLL